MFIKNVLNSSSLKDTQEDDKDILKYLVIRSYVD